jgi:hypothetical protein
MGEDSGKGFSGRFTETSDGKKLMRDLFQLPVYAGGLCVLDAQNCDLGAFDTEVQAHGAAHAINSYDRLAEECAALRIEMRRLNEAVQQARLALEAMESVANSRLDALWAELQQAGALDDAWKQEYARWVGVYNALATIRALPSSI